MSNNIWEYTTISDEGEYNSDVLQTYGILGWEVYSVIRTEKEYKDYTETVTIYYLKRIKQDAQ